MQSFCQYPPVDRMQSLLIETIVVEYLIILTLGMTYLPGCYHHPRTAPAHH